ncbi:hypothetical protein G6F35_013134 [Rhizopus arrhizus]|nr:hypothetical protein G6F35_013134 [Rhizopus arrhizus]
MTDPRQALRHDLRQRRRDLSAAERIAAAELLADALLALPFAPREGAVAGYWALDGEIALHRWQLQLPEGLTYCLPVLAGDVLRFAPHAGTGADGAGGGPAGGLRPAVPAAGHGGRLV